MCLCVYVSVSICVPTYVHTYMRSYALHWFQIFSLKTQHSKLKGRSVGLLDLKESQTYFKGYYLFQKKRKTQEIFQKFFAFMLAMQDNLLSSDRAPSSALCPH